MNRINKTIIALTMIAMSAVATAEYQSQIVPGRKSMVICYSEEAIQGILDATLNMRFQEVAQYLQQELCDQVSQTFRLEVDGSTNRYSRVYFYDRSGQLNTQQEFYMFNNNIKGFQYTSKKQQVSKMFAQPDPDVIKNNLGDPNQIDSEEFGD